MFEQVWAKMHEQIVLWNSICRKCPVFPNEDDSEIWEVSGLKGSYFRFNVMCKSCLKSVRKLILSDVVVLVSFAYFLYMKQRCVSLCSQACTSHLVCYTQPSRPPLIPVFSLQS